MNTTEIKMFNENLVINSIKSFLEIKKDALAKHLLSKVFLIDSVRLIKAEHDLLSESNKSQIEDYTEFYEYLRNSASVYTFAFMRFYYKQTRGILVYGLKQSRGSLFYTRI